MATARKKATPSSTAARPTKQTAPVGRKAAAPAAGKQAAAPAAGKQAAAPAARKRATAPVSMPAPARAPARSRGAIAPAASASPAAPVKAAAVAAAPMARGMIVGLKVALTLNARNGLRRVIFGLEKKVAGSTTTWIIHFELLERASRSEAFADPLVLLDVEVDSKLNKKAETAASKGLTPDQAAHALGPASSDAKAAKAGEIDEAEASQTVQDTLAQK
ncbi:MAG: hypothetical protein JNJ71_16380 [Rubrivivax sp.]|nr:hypothetical protein [Rubrivivax sp.]